jgi:hypothetical protein
MKRLDVDPVQLTLDIGEDQGGDHGAFSDVSAGAIP